MASMAIVATGVTADMDGADGASTPLGTPIITVVATGDMDVAGADIELAWLVQTASARMLVPGQFCLSTEARLRSTF